MSDATPELSPCRAVLRDAGMPYNPVKEHMPLVVPVPPPGALHRRRKAMFSDIHSAAVAVGVVPNGAAPAPTPVSVPPPSIEPKVAPAQDTTLQETETVTQQDDAVDGLSSGTSNDPVPTPEDMSRVSHGKRQADDSSSEEEEEEDDDDEEEEVAPEDVGHEDDDIDSLLGESSADGDSGGAEDDDADFSDDGEPADEDGDESSEEEPAGAADPKKTDDAVMADAAESAESKKAIDATDALSKMTISELKALAKEHGLVTTNMRSKRSLLTLITGKAQPPLPPPVSEKKNKNKNKAPPPAAVVKAVPAAVEMEPVPRAKPRAKPRAPAPAMAKPASRKRVASSALTEPNWDKHRRLHESFLACESSADQKETLNDALGARVITLSADKLPAFLALARRSRYCHEVSSVDAYKRALASAEDGSEEWNEFIASSARREGILGFHKPAPPPFDVMKYM